MRERGLVLCLGRNSPCYNSVEACITLGFLDSQIFFGKPTLMEIVSTSFLLLVGNLSDVIATNIHSKSPCRVIWSEYE